MWHSPNMVHSMDHGRVFYIWTRQPHWEGISYPPILDVLDNSMGWTLKSATNGPGVNNAKLYYGSWPGQDNFWRVEEVSKRI